MQFSSGPGAGDRGGAAGREGGEEEEGEILTTNNHNAIHNALSPRDYMVYFQWGLAHPSQPFIGPFFCCIKPKHYRKILNRLIAAL